MSYTELQHYHHLTYAGQVRVCRTTLNNTVPLGGNKTKQSPGFDPLSHCVNAFHKYRVQFTRTIEYYAVIFKTCT